MWWHRPVTPGGSQPSSGLALTTQKNSVSAKQIQKTNKQTNKKPRNDSF